MPRWPQNLLGRPSRRPYLQSKVRAFEVLEDRQMMTASPVFSGASIGGFDERSSGAGPTAIPALSSLPGAAATIYLDFNGHSQAKPAISGSPALLTLDSFKVDSPNQADRESAIREIWAQVSEDYAPFNVNVTTVSPGDLSAASHNLRVVITDTPDYDPANNIGISTHNSFSNANLENIAYVFARNRADDATNPSRLRPVSIIAKVVSHEAGHTFGLDHQSQWNGDTLVKELHEGDPLTKVGPIMGQPPATFRMVWSNGINKFGNVQDDMAIIASAKNGFGFRPDEIGTSFAEPEQLTKYDPVFGTLVGSGVISTASDADVFRFDWGGGQAIIGLYVGTAGHIDSPNLDAVMELYRGGPSATLVKREASPVSLGGTIVADLSAGVYFLKIGSQGGYGDVGQYRISVIDNNGPRVTSATTATTGSNVTGIWITFNKEIDAATFTKSDIVATGVTVLSIAQDNDPWRFFVAITPVSQNASWRLTVGPDVRDRFGNVMDQNRDGELGQVNDMYVFNHLGSGGLDPVGGTTPVKKVKLTPRLADLAFSR